MIKEFKPALWFLFKFLSIYIVGNLIYGFFIEAVNPNPDVITKFVTKQTAGILHHFDESIVSQPNPIEPTVFIRDESQVVINVFEGCNGVNVMIVFVAFVVAFGGRWLDMLWFIGGGVVIIHILNLLRLSFLYYLAKNNPEHFYFFHKYLFTAILYIAVFILWAIWIKRFHDHSGRKTKATAMDKS